MRSACVCRRGCGCLPRQFTQPGLQVTEVAGADEAAGTKTVQVKLDRPLLGPVEVQLLTELRRWARPSFRNSN